MVEKASEKHNKGKIMNEKIKNLIEGLKLAEGASEEELSRLEADLGGRLPSDYVDFIRYSKSAEGPIGITNYLVLWPVEEIKSLNDNYGITEFAPGLILFGGDGGDTGYTFDARDKEMPIVAVSLSDLSLDFIKPMGKNFVEFLEYLSKT
jgi:hypothetical protein